jgi:hypothetical protein
MDDKKKGAGQIVPDSEKENLDQYPDEVKSPLTGLEDTKTTMKKALSDEKEDGE